ncbi:MULTISPECIES: DUF998 domain-containing protein [unclassified Streptomyces]|uniref:DUF998 domain-containing protein n=1 Tax=unclassified Streptomyces TaxID=2593676 RepID=UPI002E35B93C|nr:DUF998 domain-containing protein [Streptomyces sp. NBC_01268]
MRRVPRWALISSGCAPVLLIGGWTIAGLLHGPGYDPVTQTISVLAAYGAPGAWVMTGGLFGLGVCHLVTAWGLRAAALAGRVALAAGGVTALVVALLPAPLSGGSLRHGSVAAAGFAFLALWPVLAADRAGPAPWGLRPVPAVGVTALMGLGAGWFLVDMQRHGAVGVAERLVTCLQSVWPLVVVVSCLLYGKGGHRPPKGPASAS